MWFLDQSPGYLDCFGQQTLYSDSIQSAREATLYQSLQGRWGGKLQPCCGTQDVLLPIHPFRTNQPTNVCFTFSACQINGAKCWGHTSKQVSALLDGTCILQGKTDKNDHQIVKRVVLENNKRLVWFREGSPGRAY